MIDNISLSKSWKVQSPEVRHVYETYKFAGLKRLFVSAVGGERDDRRNSITQIHPHWQGLVVAIPYGQERRIQSSYSDAPVMLSAILPPAMAEHYFSNAKIPTGYEEDEVFDVMEKRTFNDMVVVANAALHIAVYQHPKYLSGTTVTRNDIKDGIIDPISIYNVKGILRDAENTVTSMTTRGILFSVNLPNLASEEIDDDSLEIYDPTVIQAWNIS